MSFAAIPVSCHDASMHANFQHLSMCQVACPESLLQQVSTQLHIAQIEFNNFLLVGEILKKMTLHTMACLTAPSQRSKKLVNFYAAKNGSGEEQGCHESGKASPTSQS